MRELRYTLVSDGSSDRALMPLLTWLLRQHLDDDCPIQPAWADLTRLPRRPKGLEERVRAALDLFPCDLLFVHRDAEREPLERRLEEIKAACAALGDAVAVVGVVPVRMQEAWLLLDGVAVRRAAGNPNGRDPLEIPPLKRLDKLPDPKEILYALLRDASGLTGRRLKRFSAQASALRVAEFIDDFTPLRGLTAFAVLEEELIQVIGQRGWAEA
jgi:hypothetical protein